MSSPRFGWWPYAKNMIRRYPSLAEEYKALHEQGVTPAYSGMPGGGGEGRPLEQVALRELPGGRQKEYDAVRLAIEATQALPNGKERLAVVSFVFWEGRRGRRLLSQAAGKVGYSYVQVIRFHRDFILLVGANFGLPGAAEAVKMDPESQKDVL